MIVSLLVLFFEVTLSFYHYHRLRQLPNLVSTVTELLFLTRKFCSVTYLQHIHARPRYSSFKAEKTPPYSSQKQATETIS